MNETTDRVATPCPSCSPATDTVHEVLATGGGRATLRCTECDHVHKEKLPGTQTVEPTVIVSQSGESFTATAEVPADETLRRGEEFVLETDEAILEVRITDLQVSDEERTPEATARDVGTVWTREVGNVGVDVTVNPGGGSATSRSVTVHVPGDYEFAVGETETFGDETFAVTGAHVRDDAVGYDFDKLDHEGDTVLAKDVQRLYAVDETSEAWSAW